MNIQLLHGDCRQVLKTLPAESINWCVTSPPYWGLRDYGVDGQIGLEDSPEAFVVEMVSVFHEVYRVLRPDGTCWLNLGDSYSAHPGQRKTTDKCGEKQKTNSASTGTPSRHVRRGSGRADGVVTADSPRNRDGAPPCGLAAKNLIGIPWRVALALQADGWYLRQDIIWHKPNPMPESVTDRCTKAHEYVFLLSKSERYYFDQEAIKEPATGWNGSDFHDGRNAEVHPNVGKNRPSKKRGEFGGKTADIPSREAFRAVTETRNKRSVWTVNTRPYKEAHFATFPPALITPMILAGCPSGGTVLDPFGGSGTTGEVAESLGRNSILIELNPAYIEIQGRRTAQQGLSL